MKHRYTPLLLLIFPLLFRAAGAAQTPKSLLWEISGNGLPGPSYLYGTMHVGDKRAFQFSKSVMPSFERSPAFAMELDPGKTDPFALMEMMKLDSGKLQDLFTPEQWAQLDGYMQEKLKTPAEKFNEFSPFFVYSMIAQVQFKNQKGQALDIYFYKQAQKGDKAIYGLETVEEQLDAINRMGPEGQVKMLMDAVQGKEAEADMEEMMKYYVQGDLDKLHALSEGVDYGSEFEKAMIVDRNHRMAERLEPLIQKESTFIAVGALHLPGAEGLLKLLEQEGYTIKPLK